MSETLFGDDPEEPDNCVACGHDAAGHGPDGCRYWNCQCKGAAGTSSDPLKREREAPREAPISPVVPVAGGVPSGQTVHAQEARQRALRAIKETGIPHFGAEAILDALEAESSGWGWCVCCGYKRKASPGMEGAATLTPLVGLEHLIRDNDEPDGLGAESDPNVKLGKALKVLDWLCGGAKTAGEIVDLGTQQHPETDNNGWNPVITKLVRDGWVRDSGRRSLSPRNRPMIVWELTPAARDVINGRRPIPE